MKTIRLIKILSIVILASNLLVSCHHASGYQIFLIKVDSIQVPNALVAKESFDINFFGTIGSNSCFSFSSFNVKQENANILIEAWGKAESNVSLTQPVMVYLTGHKVNYNIQIPGTYNIKIKQPDNTYLEKQIDIK